VEGGVRKLEGIAAEEGAPAQADMALLTGYLRQGETARALEVARTMTKKRPDDPMSHQALGSVLLIQKDIPAARVAFGKAVELNPTFMPAVAALAQLDVQENKLPDARARFEAVLAKDPKNEAALLGLAEVMARARSPSAEINAVLQRAIAANPGSVNARLALINLYLRDGDARAALTAAQEAAANSNRNARILDALGRAQVAAGETNQAIDTFNRLAAEEPRSTLPLLRLASVYVSRKEPERAADALLRAQKLAPADPNVTRDLVVVYLMMGKTDEALKQAKALQASAPKSAAGHVLEGDVHSASRQWPLAEKAYRDAGKVEPASSGVAIKLLNVLQASGRKSDADAFSRKWVADHPKDAGFRAYLGEQALRARDFKGAAAHYEAVVGQQPDNAVALNNLAWALGQLDDPRAIGYAERALKIAPDSAAVLDTLGTLLTAKGDAAKGAEYLARAVRLAPQRHDFRLNYAKALLKTGRNEEARKELSQLQSVSDDFPGKAELPELLKK
jgi:putative PEP-CTERM system TPR-repeat lipoprotein